MAISSPIHAPFTLLQAGLPSESWYWQKHSRSNAGIRLLVLPHSYRWDSLINLCPLHYPTCQRILLKFPLRLAYFSLFSEMSMAPHVCWINYKSVNTNSKPVWYISIDITNRSPQLITFCFLTQILYSSKIEQLVYPHIFQYLLSFRALFLFSSVKNIFFNMILNITFYKK